MSKHFSIPSECVLHGAEMNIPRMVDMKLYFINMSGDITPPHPDWAKSKNLVDVDDKNWRTKQMGNSATTENVCTQSIPIKKTYAYHKPSLAGLFKIAALRQLFSYVHDNIEALAPLSRERSVALTELENCAMWAIKAVVCNDPESEVTV